MSEDADTSYEFAPRAPEPEARPRPEPAAAPEAQVERQCPHCGFRIVGKAPRSRCPDCAAPLDMTAVDLLQFSSAGWVRTLSVGTLLLCLSVFVQIGAVVAAWARREPLGGYLHVGGPALALIGAWLATLRERGVGARAVSGRMAVRAASLLVLGAWVLLEFGLLPEGAAHPVLYLAVLLTGAQIVALGVYLNAMAVRIPSDALAWQSFNVGWIIALECVFIVGLHFVAVADRYYLQFFFCAFPMIAGLVGLPLWGAAILLQFTLAFNAAAGAGQDIVRRKAAREAAAAKIAAARSRKGPPAR